MFGIGSTELLIIVVFGFLLFGPDKLPQMGRTLGRALRQFRETQEKMTSVVQTEVLDPMAAAANATPKTPAAAAAADDDADADDAAAASTPRKETFAERRARLAAEKAATAVPGAEAEEGPVVSEDTGAPAAPVVDEATASAEASAPAPSTPAEEAPAPRTTADLYARRPRRPRDTDAAADADVSQEGGER